MTYMRYLLLLLIYPVLLLGFENPLPAQIQRHGWNGVVVKEISPRVTVVRDGVPQPMFHWGMSLFENDEIQTGETGQAEIQFSSNGSGNEINLGVNTRVKISRTSSEYDYSTYRIDVLAGKIWARDLPSQARKVQVNAGKSKIIPFGGQFTVEQDEEQTLAAASLGNIRILDRSTSRYSQLPPGRIASVSAKTGDMMIMVIPEQLLAAFHSAETPAAGESSQQIKALVADRIARIDEILEEEAREAAAKKAREEGLKKEKEEAELRAAAMAVEQQEAEKARQDRMRAEQLAGKTAVGGSQEPADAKTALAAGPAAAGLSRTPGAENATQSAAAAGTDPKSSVQTGTTVEKSADAGKPAAEEKPLKQDPAAKTGSQAAAPREAAVTEPAKKQPQAKQPAPAAQSPVRVSKPKPVRKPQTTKTRDQQSLQRAAKAKKEESLLQTFKWDLVTMSTALVFAWLSTEEAKKYDALETKNETLQTQWASATTTSARSALEVQYEVNKSKMSTYKANVNLYNNITLLAIIFEGYLIYDHLFGDDPDGRAALPAPGYHHIINPDTVVIGFSKPSAPAGINLTLGWKW